MRHGPVRPSLAALVEYVGLYWIFSAHFLFFYTFTNRSASEASDLLHLYLPIELEIPFIPEAFIVYFSIQLLILSPMFFLERYENRRFFVAMMLATTTAAFFFYFFPCANGFVRNIPTHEPWKTILTGFYAQDEPHNLVPSLHVSYSTSVILFLREKLRGSWYKGFHLWAMAIYFSVILTHQHHLLDIPTGILLSVLVHRIFRRWGPRMGHYFNPPQKNLHKPT